MSKTLHECMYDDYETYFPSHATKTVRYRPCGKQAIIVTLNDGVELIYDSMDNSLFYDKPRLIDESGEEYVKRKINRRLKFFMNNRRIGQEQLSERTGITQAMISRYVTGKSVPSVLNLYKIAEALDCNIGDIIN